MRIMSFGEHLEELRTRLVLALLVPIPLFILCLFFGQRLFQFILAPLLDSLSRAGEPQQLLATSPIEPFAAYVKVALVISVLVSFPWVLYQAWKFVSPGLYAKERRFIYFLVPLSGLLSALGLAFVYKVLLPLCLYFLIQFGSSIGRLPVVEAPLPAGIVLPALPVLDADPPGAPVGSMWVNKTLGQMRLKVADGDVRGTPLAHGSGVAQQYRLSEYTSLVFMLGLAFALAFQLPVVLMLLSWVGLVESSLLAQNRKYALLAAVVVGALLPTQDPASLFMLTAVLYALFEFGLILMRFVPADRVARGFSGKPPAPATDGEQGDD